MADVPLLSLHGVCKRFGALRALTDVDLEVRAGEVLALVGDNGAGKSTLVKTISGVISPDAGQIAWQGGEQRIERHSADITGPPRAVNDGAVGRRAPQYAGAGRGA